MTFNFADYTTRIFDSSETDATERGRDTDPEIRLYDGPPPLISVLRLVTIAVRPPLSDPVPKRFLPIPSAGDPDSQDDAIAIFVFDEGQRAIDAVRGRYDPRIFLLVRPGKRTSQSLSLSLSERDV